MQETLTVEQVVELAVVERSGFVESRHLGAAIVLSPDGDVIASLGDPSALVLPRSSLKPLQAVASITAGAELNPLEQGLATASHAGTDAHVEIVRGMLERHGLSENDLGCPPAWPSDSRTRAALQRDLGEPQRLRMNCSGKHAAMLCACLASGWPTRGYLDPEHPLQLHVREIVERFADEKVAHTAVDGCGAPVFAMSLHALARGIHRAGSAALTSTFAVHRAAAAVVQAVRDEPWTIEGPGCADTLAIETLDVFTKSGAEGVCVMVAPNGTTVALKMLDGSARAATLVAATLLARAEAISPAVLAELEQRLPLSVRGADREVGRIRLAAGLGPSTGSGIGAPTLPA